MSLSLANAPLAVILADLPACEPGTPAEGELAGLIGRKALSLLQLTRHGLPVPPAGVVTTAAYAEALSLAPSFAGPLPPGVEAAILETYRALGGGPVAVRSSGAAEDLAGASFAGMYESFLNIEGEAAVLEAVRRCWASAWSERVAAYAEHQGLARPQLAMGVVLQRLVAADVAGVLFTLDPTSGREEEMRIEACLGLGEALVGGQVQPDSYVIARGDGRALKSDVVPKTRMLVRAPGGGVVERRPENGDAPALNATQLSELARLGRASQAYFGCPQDLEWAFAEGRLWLLQSRPITTIVYSGIEGEWTTADFKDGGVSASVCSPYMWSLYDSIWQVTMPGYLRKIKLLRHERPVVWGRVFYGRPFWNCGEVKLCLHRVPGFKERDFDRDLGIEGTYEGDGVVVPTTFKTVLAALPTLFALEADYAERIRLNERFVKDFPAMAARYDADPAGLERAALTERYRQLLTRDYFATESAYFYTIYNTANAKLDFKASLDGLNEPISALNLLSGLRELRHLHPLRDMWQLAGQARQDEPLRRAILDTPAEELQDRLANAFPAFWAELAAFLQRYRHHAMTELDITQPRWNEDPVFVLRLLQGYVQNHDPAREPMAANERQYQVYLAEARRAREAVARKDLATRLIAAGWLGTLERGFFAKLERCRLYAWWREELRDHSSRMYALVRRETLAVARLLAREGVLDKAEDVWLLRFPEVIDLLDGKLAPEAARALVSDRREEGAGWIRFSNPNELGQGFKPAAAVVAADGSLSGIACSPGRVRARVRVVPTIADAHALQPGEVLVTKFTDPGWTPLFGAIAGVVTETGGVLSHAAVIAREYGIPAVLAVPEATRRLKDGQWVWVDGQAGTVSPAEEA